MTSYRPAIAGDATVYTDQLAGAPLEQLLEAAEDDCWPNSQCKPEWVLLRNWAIQRESLMVDEAEDRAWERQMCELAKRGLPYTEWIEERGLMLKERARARKLAQANLRYKYGYRGHRRWGLIRRTVRDVYLAWADGEQSRNVR